MVAGRLAEPELFVQHELELAVLECVELRVRDANGLVQRAARVGPLALIPPGGRVDAERGEPVDRGEASRSRRGSVREGPAKRDDRLLAGQWCGRSKRGSRSPRDAELVHETRSRGDRLVAAHVARRAHDAPGRPPHHRAEQAPLVVEAKSVPLRLRHRSLEDGEVEHRFRSRQAGEVPLETPRDQHGVELRTDRPVRGEDVHGVGFGRGRGLRAGAFATRLEPFQERLGRRVGALSPALDRGSKSEHRVEVATRLLVRRAVFDEAARVRERRPEDTERVVDGSGLSTLDQTGDLLVPTDFRSVYAETISGWLGGDPTQILPGIGSAGNPPPAVTRGDGRSGLFR